MAEDELSAEDKQTLAELAEWWRESGMTRRAALAGAVGGAGLAAGFGAGQAAAAPTGDEGAVGESGNRVEAWISEMDATEVTTDQSDINYLAGKGQKNSTQNIPSGSATQMSLDTAIYEDSNAVNVDTSNDKLVAQLAGTYIIDAGVDFQDDIGDGTSVKAAIKINSTIVAAQKFNPGAANNVTFCINVQERLSQNDEITVDVTHFDGGGRNLAGKTNFIAAARIG